MNDAPLPLIPACAPFSPAQRAWLNGFFAGLYGPSDQPIGRPATGAPEPEESARRHNPMAGV
jgi:sulfite reductase (NADPH) flavoprotein alpha-component